MFCEFFTNFEYLFLYFKNLGAVSVVQLVKCMRSMRVALSLISSNIMSTVV